MLGKKVCLFLNTAPLAFVCMGLSYIEHTCILPLAFYKLLKQWELIKRSGKQHRSLIIKQHFYYICNAVKIRTLPVLDDYCRRQTWRRKQFYTVYIYQSFSHGLSGGHVTVYTETSCFSRASNVWVLASHGHMLS